MDEFTRWRKTEDDFELSACSVCPPMPNANCPIERTKERKGTVTELRTVRTSQAAARPRRGRGRGLSGLRIGSSHERTDGRTRRRTVSSSLVVNSTEVVAPRSLYLARCVGAVAEGRSNKFIAQFADLVSGEFLIRIPRSGRRTDGLTDGRAHARTQQGRQNCVLVFLGNPRWA